MEALARRVPPSSRTSGRGGAGFVWDHPLADCRQPSANTTLDFDREGNGSCANSGFPEPPPYPKVILPWTSNVVSFNRSNLFGSTTALDYSTVFANRWAKLVPFQYPAGQVHQLVSTDTPPMTYFGLPMIGFMANDYVNKTLIVAGQKVLSNYSATSPHKGIARIQ